MDKKKDRTKKSGVTRKKKKEKNSWISFFTSYRFLYGALIVLAVIVLLLGIMVFVKAKEKKENTANLVFPILEEHSHNSMNLDLNELSKKKEYSIKVANYRKDDVNAKNVEYSLIVRNTTGIEIEVIKKGDPANLIVDQEATRVEGLLLLGGVKQEDIYLIRIKEGFTPSKGDKISIEIES